MVDKDPRQFDLGLGIEQIRGMDQPQGLLLQRQRDFRMAVAEDVHGNASQKVQVLASLDVKHTRPLSSGESQGIPGDRKSTRLNSSHGYISYAVFCLKKKKNEKLRHLVIDDYHVEGEVEVRTVCWS